MMARRDSEDKLRVEGPFGLGVSAHGSNVMIALLICICFGGAIFLGYLHHIDTMAREDRHTEQLDNLTYVMTLPAEAREKLHLEKPEGIRRMERRHGYTNAND